MTPRETFQALLQADVDGPEYASLLAAVVELCKTESEQGMRVMFSVPGTSVDKLHLARLFGDVPLDKMCTYSSM